MIKYEVIIYWSEDDQSFIAEVPELPGCMADGPTYQDAIASAEVVIQVARYGARDGTPYTRTTRKIDLRIAHDDSANWYHRRQRPLPDAGT